MITHTTCCDTISSRVWVAGVVHAGVPWVCHFARCVWQQTLMDVFALDLLPMLWHMFLLVGLLEDWACEEQRSAHVHSNHVKQEVKRKGRAEKIKMGGELLQRRRGTLPCLPTQLLSWLAHTRAEQRWRSHLQPIRPQCRSSAHIMPGMSCTRS